MKLMIFYTTVSLIFLFATCGPIPVKYIPVSNNVNPTNELSNLNNTRQMLKCRIDQSHFPNKKVENTIKVIFQNLSNDTISFDKNTFLQLTTRVNIIDSIQLKKLWLQDYKKLLLPKDELSIVHTYWSNTFNGSLNDLINSLKPEIIKIFVTYKINNHFFNDSVFLKPDLERLSKHSKL